MYQRLNIQIQFYVNDSRRIIANDNANLYSFFSLLEFLEKFKNSNMEYQLYIKGYKRVKKEIFYYIICDKRCTLIQYNNSFTFTKDYIFNNAKLQYYRNLINLFDI